MPYRYDPGYGAPVPERHADEGTAYDRRRRAYGEPLDESFYSGSYGRPPQPPPHRLRRRLLPLPAAVLLPRRRPVRLARTGTLRLRRPGHADYYPPPDHGRMVPYTYVPHHVSPSNRLVALLLCFFLGVLGVHRFYVGKVGTGIIWLFTVGFLGIGVFIDFILIALGAFTDVDGRRVSRWDG